MSVTLIWSCNHFTLFNMNGCLWFVAVAVRVHTSRNEDVNADESANGHDDGVKTDTRSMEIKVEI